MKTRRGFHAKDPEAETIMLPSILPIEGLAEVPSKSQTERRMTGKPKSPPYGGNGISFIIRHLATSWTP